MRHDGVGAGPWNAANLESDTRREAHLITERLREDRILGADDDGTTKRFRPAATHVRKRLIDAGERAGIARKVNRTAHRAPETNDLPRSKNLGAIAHTEGAGQTDLVDVGQSLPIVPVRAEQLAGRAMRRQGGCRWYEPETRVAEEGRQRGSGFRGAGLGTRGGLSRRRRRLRRGGSHAYLGEE